MNVKFSNEWPQLAIGIGWYSTFDYHYFGAFFGPWCVEIEWSRRKSRPARPPRRRRSR